jgi:hypothetical protein
MGGLYLVKGVPLFLQLAVLTLYPLAFGLLLVSLKNKDSKKAALALRFSKLFSLLAFSLSSFLLFTPWDESFINLRHSLNLAETNLFSFNISNPSEGTVDFLVFYILGLLGKLGLPLFELLLFQSWLGGICCVFALKYLAEALEIPYAKQSSIFIATLFPPLLLNSALGFAATFYAAAILWAFYFTFFKKSPVMSFALLGLIPAIRWEGFWIAFLCYLYYAKELWTRREQTSRIVILGIGASIPGLLLAFYRLKHFKSLVPVPVIYKSSLGNPFYLVLGIRNLFLDTLSSFSLAFFIAYVLVLLFDSENRDKKKLLYYPLLILILATLPYYLSGGDWFPPAWGRYFFPLTLFLIPTTCKLISLCSHENKKWITLSLLFSSFICGAAPTSSLIRFYELLFSHGSALLSLNLKKRTENPLYRPHYLSALGEHLKKTTLENETLGTSELATLSYFSKRKTIDFLGLTDLKLAQTPLRKTPSFVRKNPKAAELPLLIFKRVAPERVLSEHPDYLYLFDFMIEILMNEKNTESWSSSDYFKALHRWNSKFKGLVEPLYGGTEFLISLGYNPIIVNYDNDFCALYFAHSRVLNNHREKLKTLGFKELEFDFNNQ